MSRVFSIDVNGETIRLLPELSFVGQDYHFTWYEQPLAEQTLLLSGGPATGAGRLLLDVGDKKGAPKVERYFVKKGR